MKVHGSPALGVLFLAALAALVSTAACTPPPRGEARSSHDADGDHDGDHHGDHHDDGALPELPTDAATMLAAQRLMVTPDALKCPSEMLGIVDVHTRGGSEAEALRQLRIRAVMLGAEGLTNVEFRHGDHQEKLHLSATAVRCHDILRGRRYDVVANIDFSKPMGREEEAFAELRQRGRAAGANVILDVHFEHGDAANLHITAKAVRAFDP